jgi:hypothetical protein
MAELTDGMRAVALTAETLARHAPKRWWHRRETATPFDYVPVAREVVAELISAGYIDRSVLQAVAGSATPDDDG